MIDRATIAHTKPALVLSTWKLAVTEGHAIARQAEGQLQSDAPLLTRYFRSCWRGGPVAP